MVTAQYDSLFEQKVRKIKNAADKEKIKKQIIKILESPEVGKPMRYSRKGTREVYVSSFRLSYIYYQRENSVLFLDLYHKDEQ